MLSQYIDSQRCWAQKNNYHFCEDNNPWNGQGRAIHIFSEEVGEQQDGYPGGDIVERKCQICGHIWKEEVPQ